LSLVSLPRRVPTDSGLHVSAHTDYQANRAARGDVRDIQFVLGTKQSNVSRHPSYLKNCGLIQHRRSAYRVYYQIAASVSVEHKLLFDCLGHALGREELFGTDLKKLRAAVKNGPCTVSEWSPRDGTANLGRSRISPK